MIWMTDEQAIRDILEIGRRMYAKGFAAGNDGNISSFLREELASNIRRGEQSILFLNRRGTAKLVSCVDCGYHYQCPNCSVHLTYHSANRRLMCHVCGYSAPVSKRCPDCGGELKFSGDGTERWRNSSRDFSRKRRYCASIWTPFQLRAAMSRCLRDSVQSRSPS